MKRIALVAVCILLFGLLWACTSEQTADPTGQNTQPTVSQVAPTTSENTGPKPSATTPNTLSDETTQATLDTMPTEPLPVQTEPEPTETSEQQVTEPAGDWAPGPNELPRMP